MSMSHSKDHEDRTGPPVEPDTPPAPRDEAPAEAPPEAGSLDELTKERDNLLARLQRVSADYVNFQKRMERDLQTARTYANESLIKALLAVLDDMDRALSAARDHHGEDDPLFSGMQLVHDKTIETLGRFGLKAIEAEGMPFDPQLHAAMLQQPSTDATPQTVLTEVIKGYLLKGRTIRPSGVVVAVAPEPADEPGAEERPQSEQP